MLNGKFEKIYSLCIPCSEFAFANYKKKINAQLKTFMELVVVLGYLMFKYPYEALQKI